MKEFVKSMIPESGVKVVKKVVDTITYLNLNLVVKSKFLSSLYYLLFSNHFGREHQSVIYGKLKYLEDIQSTQDSQYLLRRNIHRLEKGLIMRPRKSTFAIEYIEETVKCYENSVRANNLDISESSELQWAHDVLQEYFNSVSSQSVIDKSKGVFLALDTTSPNGKYRIPYKRDSSNPVPVNYENLLRLSQQRRSVRWYLPKSIPRELIDKAISVASLSPSACNRQPFEFRIFDEPELVKQVASTPMGTHGFSHNFPVIVVVIGQLRAYLNERDRHVIYIDGGLAAMSFMYALETLGLSSCPINWPDIEERERKMSELLKLEPDERVIMLISLGYPDPDGMIPYSQKKDLNLLRKYYPK
jgi:nitroreductase